MNLLLHNIQLMEDRGTEFFISNEIGRRRPSTAYFIAKNLNRIKGYYPEKKRIKKKKKKQKKWLSDWLTLDSVVQLYTRSD